MLIAIDMLFARPSGARRTEQEERDAQAGENPAVFPLAIPMIAGPGTIADRHAAGEPGARRRLQVLDGVLQPTQGAC